MVKEFLFSDRPTLFSRLAMACQTHLTKALADRGTATFMVSGGNTPAPLFAALSSSDLDWKNIKVALVDERWVDCVHSASNEALIYRSLLINNAKQGTFIGMKTKAASAAEGCAETEGLYQGLPKPFAVTLLGMGSDGHTASLFPHAEGLTAALAKESKLLTAAILAKPSTVTGPNTERLTLTLSGLLHSERLIVLLTGEEKLAIFREAAEGGSMEDMPIRAVLQQNQVPVELYWAP